MPSEHTSTSGGGLPIEPIPPTISSEPIVDLPIEWDHIQVMRPSTQVDWRDVLKYVWVIFIAQSENTRNINTRIRKTVTLEAWKLNQLGDLYNFSDHEGVHDSLAEHENLIDFLMDASPQIHLHFRDVKSIDLVLRSDTEDDSEELFGYINSSMPADDAQASLDAFDEEWFLEHSLLTRGRLNFDISFR